LTLVKTGRPRQDSMWRMPRHALPCDPGRRRFLRAAAVPLLASTTACGERAGGLDTTYLGRYIFYNRPTNRDFERMPQRALRASASPQQLPEAPPAADFARLAVTVRRGEPPVALAPLLADTGTTALVVLDRGSLAWEHYPNAGAREQPNRCFSVTKSVASALVGIALGEDARETLQAPIGRWLPELRDARARGLSLAHLLEMRSGIGFSEGLAPWRDEPRTYYADDLRERILDCRVSDPVGAYFHYNDWHPLLLALILERATGKRVTDLLQTGLWDPLGCEYGASMMVDRAGAAGLEHLESGLTARALDLAKLGQLYLQDGVWRGRRLLPAGWVEATTSPAHARSDADWFAYYRDRPWGRFLAGGRVYYQRMWWGYRLDEQRHDYFAMGVLGQHVYVSPDTQTVIVRLSDRFPPGMWWAPVFRQIAEAVAAARIATRG
jgi:CubicO group peptidase (beta-lactamase class C family)